MAHLWDRGVLTTSSWHGLEEIGVMADANAQIAHGERSGAWPVAGHFDTLTTAAGLVAPAQAVVVDYLNHPSRVVGVVGDRYRPVGCDEWRALCVAAVEAGAKPTGAFSLKDGSRVLATFEIGESNGLRTQLLLADAFDGTMRTSCGFTTVRVVCANTLAAAFGESGSDMAKIRHTTNAGAKIEALRAGIADAIKSGQTVRSRFEEATKRVLTADVAKNAFDALFPVAAQGASKATITRANNARDAARVAAALPINRVGGRGNLATLWNAATYLVDRNVDGTTRETRGGSMLDSMLFGDRAKRVEEIQRVVEVVLRDGTIKPMTVSEAVDTGAVDGKAVLDMMLD